MFLDPSQMISYLCVRVATLTIAAGAEASRMRRANGSIGSAPPLYRLHAAGIHFSLYHLQHSLHPLRGDWTPSWWRIVRTVAAINISGIAVIPKAILLAYERTRSSRAPTPCRSHPYRCDGAVTGMIFQFLPTCLVESNH